MRILPLLLVTACAMPTHEASVPHAPPITLTGSAFVPGQPASLVMEGLDPFETAHFVRGVNLGSGPCIATAGNLCLDITRTVYIGQRDADFTGRASFNLTVPARLPPGTEGYFQGIAIRGQQSVKTNTLRVQIAGDDIDGDGFPQATDCDDTNPEVYPGAFEICDGIDNDCDASTTEAGRILVDGTTAVTPYALDEALSVVSPGGTIELCAGTFPMGRTQIQQSVTIRGQGQGQTILDGGGASTQMLEIRHPDVTLQGMTLRGLGWDQNVYVQVNCGTQTACAHDEAIVLRDLEITGIGVAVEVPTIYNHTLLIEDCSIHDMQPRYAALDFTTSSVDIRRTSIVDVQAFDAALLLDSASEVRGEELTFLRNIVNDAAVHAYSSTFSCIDCEWGAGLDDNQPHDLVWGRGAVYGSPTFNWFGVQSVQCAPGQGCVTL